MKRNIVFLSNILILIGLYSTICRSQKIDWKCNYAEAKQEAYLNEKFLLLYFTGGWDRFHSGSDDPRTKMEDEVWNDTAIERVARYYVCVRLTCNPGRVDLTTPVKYGELVLHHRIIEFPTTVITDPLDNEIARIVGFMPAENVEQVLNVQYPPLSRVYHVLQELEVNPDNVGLQIAVATAYGKAGFPALSNQCYDKVLDADTLRADAALCEQVDFDRALNYSKLNNWHEAISLFEKQLDKYPTSKNRPDYLFWLIKLYVQTSNKNTAQTYLNILEKEFPDSEQTRMAKTLFTK